MRRYLLVLVALFSTILGSQAFCQSLDSKVGYIGTSRYLKVVGIKTKQINRLLNLAIEINNTDYDNQQAYYRIAWFDADGFPAWEEETWKPIFVHGGQLERIMVIAPTPKAVDFKIDFSADKNRVDFSTDKSQTENPGSNTQ